MRANDEYAVKTDYIDGLAIGDKIVICPSEDLFVRKALPPDGMKFDTDIIKRNPMWFVKITDGEEPDKWELHTWGIHFGSKEQAVAEGFIRFYTQKGDKEIIFPQGITEKKARQIVNILNQ